MEWKIVSLLIEAPVIPEPAVKNTGILRACVECYRRNFSSEQILGWWRQDWEQWCAF